MTGPAVVVVTHDSRDDVLGCLATIDDASEVVVVDCGSTDGTPDAVRAADRRARVLELDNAGFGRGANAGVRAVRHAPVVVVCNADVRFGPGAIRRLHQAFAAPDVGAAGPRVCYPSGESQASARRVPGPAVIVGHALLGRAWPTNRWTRAYHGPSTSDGPRDADWLSGCAVALRRRAFDDVDGFDPGYFLYAEDVDLGTRLRAAGWRLRFVPDALVTHAVAGATDRRPFRRLVIHARSLDRYHRLHHRSVAARLSRPLVRLGLVGWVALSAVVRRVGPSGRSATGERAGGSDGRDGRERRDGRSARHGNGA
ncbi:MAG: glycosyltransferase family 2 protein [Nitriliruptoraceae bacterium]